MDKLRAAYRVNVFIGLAMMASLVVYLVIVSLIEGGTIPMRNDQPLDGVAYDIMQFVMLGFAVGIFFGIRVLNRMMLGSDAELQALAKRLPAQSAGGGNEFGRLTGAAVVTYALCEVPAIFGLVLYFLGRRVTDFYLFLLVSFFFFATYFPRYSQWEEWYRQQGRGGKGTGDAGTGRHGDRGTRGQGDTKQG